MDKQGENIGFALKSIKTEQFAVFHDNYAFKDAIDVATELEFKIDKFSRHIGAFAGFEFIQNEKTFIKILVSCHFGIQQESWIRLQDRENKQISFPKNFVAHLAALTIGASRGVLSAKTEATEFSRFMIPLLNVAEIIVEDVVFSVDEVLE